MSYDTWGGKWGQSWAFSWFKPEAGERSGAWACSWGRSWLDSWGDTSACVVTPPPVITPTPATSPGGVGGKAWSSRTRKPLTKKKRTLLEELDDALIELRGRIEERDAAEEQVAAELSEYESELRKGEALQISAMETDVSLAQIQIQLTYIREALREMDDEEALLLALH